jgi:lysophospholipase L1-like esterase
MADGVAITSVAPVSSLDRFLGLKDPGTGLAGPVQATAQSIAAQLGGLISLDSIRMGVESRTVSTPPGSPPDGARYIVPTGATGVWASHVGAIAVAQAGVWTYLAPSDGYSVVVKDEFQIYAFKDTAWAAITNVPIAQATLAALTTLMSTAVNGAKGEVISDLVSTTSSRARASNVVTLVTAAAHGLGVGVAVNVRGLSGVGYNGRITTVSGTTGTTLKYNATGGDESTTADTGGQIDRNGVYASNGAGALTWIGDETSSAQIAVAVNSAVAAEAALRTAADAALQSQITAVGDAVTQITVDAILATLPSGVDALWIPEPLFYSASPQPTLKNVVGFSTPISANLLRRNTRATLGWSWNYIKYGCTLTPGQVGPDGVLANAGRVTWGAGDPNAAIDDKIARTLPSSTYTYIFEAKSAPGADQNFRSALNTSSPSAQKTATSTWQTFTHTYTGAPNVVRPLWAYSSQAADILIANERLFEGAVDLGADPTYVGHMLLGKSKVDGVPTVANGYMTLTGSAGAIAHLQSPVTIGDVTVLAILRKTASTSGYQLIASFPKSDSIAHPDGEFAAILENDKKITGFKAGVDVQGTMFDLNGLGWQFVAKRVSSAGFATFIGDSKIASGTSTANLPNVSIQDYMIGALNELGNNVPSVDIAALAIYRRALSDSEILSAGSALSNRVASKSSISVQTSSLRVLIGEGDSITANNPSYWDLYNANALPKVVGAKYATSGNTVADLVARAAYVDAAIPAVKGSRKFILTVLIGHNDLIISGGNVSAFLTSLASYLDARRAAGWTVVLLTVLPSTQYASFNAWRNSANTTIRTWVGLHCDAIADVAADATIGADVAASNTSLYSDGTHPTDAGHVLLEPIVRAVVNAI